MAEGVARILRCGMEKGKHKCKNQKTAGADICLKILHFVIQCNARLDNRKVHIKHIHTTRTY